MNSHDRILSLLGLSLRGGNLAVGEEPVDAAARAKDARLLLLAADSADNTRRRCEHMAQVGNCLWVRLPCTKEQVGRALGRTSVALAAVTDIGLASALAKLLAELDPEQYGDTAARMAEKARRAAERKAEQAVHEKNRRLGRRKPPESSPRPPEPEREKGRPSAQNRYSSQRRSSDQRFPERRSSDGQAAGRWSSAGGSSTGKESAWRSKRDSRPNRDKRPKPKGQPRPYAHSRPVKKGKGSFRKKKEG